ncbi:MAG TPA: phosphodiester glycosidase family protein [Acidimicrobiales bacterium]|nr:phosphodiester glycosidase family protein [Acidimicrobiales bacterium]
MRPFRSWKRKVGLALLAAIGVFLIVAGWSYVSAITAPGTDSLQAKSVEWVRSHGGSGIVRWVENEWYSHHQPPKGGRANVALATHPATPFSSANYANVAHLPVPPPLHPIVPGPVEGEGQWTPVGRLVGGVPAVYSTYLRPDPAHTSLLTGVAWMDTKLLKATLFSGTDVPGAPGFKDVAPPTAEQAGQLVAQFNSGFRMQDSDGGYYSEGRLIYTMRPGAASLVIYDNGDVTVAKWGRDATMGPTVASVRQNLDLIVDQGHLVAGLQSDSTGKWGATLGNKLLVWRSGVGVTANGALVYAGGPGLSVYTLANVLLHAGAIRAMEMDINTYWVDYFFFSPQPGTPASPANGTKLLSSMYGATNRYFETSSRDFVSMSADPQPNRTSPTARR